MYIFLKSSVNKGYSLGDFFFFSNETETLKPRGCGKLVTKSYQQINFGGERGQKIHNVYNYWKVLK